MFNDQKKMIFFDLIYGIILLVGSWKLNNAQYILIVTWLGYFHYNLQLIYLGFCFDLLCDDVIMDNKLLEDYNLDQKVINLLFALNKMHFIINFTEIISYLYSTLIN